MADLIAQGAEWLAGVQESHASVTVTYTRGRESVELSAARGSTEFETNDERGHNTRLESFDWKLSPADLVLDGENIEPDRGDMIRLIQDGTTHLYQVTAFGELGVIWAWWDRSRKRIRVHTKYVGTE